MLFPTPGTCLGDTIECGAMLRVGAGMPVCYGNPMCIGWLVFFFSGRGCILISYSPLLQMYALGVARPTIVTASNLPVGGSAVFTMGVVWSGNTQVR